MKILSIDTSSNICGVAVLNGATLLKEYSQNNGLTHSETLMPIIKNVFENLNLVLEDIDLIVCDKGPGSFTGIRIGVATAKAFSDSLNKKAIGISSLEALAYNVKNDGIICSLIDAKNNNVYVSVFEKIDNNYILRRDFSVENILELLNEFADVDYNITFVGDGAIAYKDQILSALSSKSFFVENNSLSAYNLGLAGFKHFQEGILDDILPLYLRKPQAERMLESNINNSISIMPFSITELEDISDILEKDYDDFWNFNILKSELQNPSSMYLCCKKNSQIIGFAGITLVLDTAELNNIVIKKDCRGHGYSSLLLKNMIEKAKSKGCKKLNLEVAANNITAINLYKKFGFKQVGIRSKYYNGIDALLFTLVF